MASTTAQSESPLDRFVGATLKGALVVFGLATCLPILLTVDIGLGNRVLFGGGLETTPSVELIVRHWGFMIFGVGVLMIAAAFLPWLRFATLNIRRGGKDPPSRDGHCRSQSTLGPRLPDGRGA